MPEKCWETCHIQCRVNNTRSFIDNPYLFLETRFVYNYIHYQAAVKDHILFCDHVASIDDFQILATSDSDFHVKVKESLLI